VKSRIARRLVNRLLHFLDRRFYLAVAANDLA
jgi:hypothetical protein